MQWVYKSLKGKILSAFRVSELGVDRWRADAGLSSPSDKLSLSLRIVAVKAILIIRTIVKIPLWLPQWVSLLLELEELHFAPMRRMRKGKGCVVDRQTWLVNGHNITLGDYVKISTFSSIMAGYISTIHIGNNTIVGPSVLIASFNHGHSLTDVPIRYQSWQETIDDSVEIGDNVWIGGHAIILPGTKIGSGSIIGAGAIVKENVPPNTIFVNKSTSRVKLRTIIPFNAQRIKQSNRM